MAPRKKLDDGQESFGQQLHQPQPIGKRPLVPKPKESDVVELVYRFLGSLAAVENGGANNPVRPQWIRFDKNSQVRRRPGDSSRRLVRSPTPYAWDRVAAASSTKLRELSEQDDLVEHAIPQSAANLLSVGDKPKQGRSLEQKINRYIQDGIDEGKHQAKRYVQNALLFGLESGYLIPEDEEGMLLRVSSSLVLPEKSREQPATAEEVAAAASKRKPRRRTGVRRRGRTTKRLARRRTKLYRETVEERAHPEPDSLKRSREGSEKKKRPSKNTCEDSEASGTNTSEKSAEIEKKPNSSSGSSSKSKVAGSRSSKTNIEP